MNAIEDLGKTLTSQMQRVMKANNGIAIELGTIRNNRALSVDSLGSGIQIPRGDYMISGRLKNTTLYAGTRVLVAWAGTEPIVVDTVTSS